MGHESRFYVVAKSNNPPFYDDGKKWAQVIARFEMSNVPSIRYAIQKYSKTDCYIYSDGGNEERIVEDHYGAELVEIPVNEMIEILEKLHDIHEYRRYAPFYQLLKGFNLDNWDNNLVILHYGH